VIPSSNIFQPLKQSIYGLLFSLLWVKCHEIPPADNLMYILLFALVSWPQFLSLPQYAHPSFLIHTNPLYPHSSPPSFILSPPPHSYPPPPSFILTPPLPLFIHTAQTFCTSAYTRQLYCWTDHITNLLIAYTSFVRYSFPDVPGFTKSMQFWII